MSSAIVETHVGKTQTGGSARLPLSADNHSNRSDLRADFILTLACKDRIGIVHAVSSFLATNGCNICDSAQFSDHSAGELFMRVTFNVPGISLSDLKTIFVDVATSFSMAWQLHDCKVRPRSMILVSKAGHCLNDLLFRYGTGTLDIDIPVIASNHRDFYKLAATYDIPFHHFPLTPETKLSQEAKLLDLVEQERIDFVVLARYMQVLSDDFCQKLKGRIINIHHSFLPSFKGARPYHQAHSRGVKLIGATAHYVTADLDEGPIIEQEVSRVDHAMTPEDLSAMGRDIEAIVLARAVKFHSENRVLLNGNRTVVFR